VTVNVPVDAARMLASVLKAVSVKTKATAAKVDTAVTWVFP
jgi:hypothetical protein